jgi:hypothetical protein
LNVNDPISQTNSSGLHCGQWKWMVVATLALHLPGELAWAPFGVRTTTESKSPDLTAQLQAHVSSMYAHLDQGTEVACMSQSLPTLFRHASGYRRQLTFTPTG